MVLELKAVVQVTRQCHSMVVTVVSHLTNKRGGAQPHSYIHVNQLNIIMQLQDLKQQIIDQLGEMYDEHFIVDINDCDSGFELLRTLEQYGYDTQGGLSILFSILIS